jgi:hypothetical protein
MQIDTPSNFAQMNRAHKLAEACDRVNSGNAAIGRIHTSCGGDFVELSGWRATLPSLILISERPK